MSYGFLEKLKTGAKKQILVPMDKGRNMLGVIDETGQLEYGQVHVKYTCGKTGKLLLLTGTMQLCSAKWYVTTHLRFT